MSKFLLGMSAMLVALAFAPGCSNGGGGADGGDASTNDGTVNDTSSNGDTRTDAPADTSANLLFSTCTTNAQCQPLGAGFKCLAGGIAGSPFAFPGGLCTKRCTTNAQCGASGTCLTAAGICLPGCTSGGMECNPFGGQCVPLTNDPASDRICTPACFTADRTPPDPNWPTCPAAAACDLYTGECDGMTPTGAENGEPCAADADCKGGRCITEIDTSGAPTGFIGGMCISFGLLTGNMLNMPIPPSNCPTGSAPVPFSDNAPGDNSACFPLCDTAHPCRAGYACSPLENAAHMMTTNGFCFPEDCNMTGMTCPTGYHCQSQPSDAAVPPGQCEANAVTTDGGTPDAAAPDAAVDVVLPPEDVITVPDVTVPDA